MEREIRNLDPDPVFLTPFSYRFRDGRVGRAQRGLHALRPEFAGVAVEARGIVKFHLRSFFPDHFPLLKA